MEFQSLKTNLTFFITEIINIQCCRKLYLTKLKKYTRRLSKKIFANEKQITSQHNLTCFSRVWWKKANLICWILKIQGRIMHQKTFLCFAYSFRRFRRIRNLLQFYVLLFGGPCITKRRSRSQRSNSFKLGFYQLYFNTRPAEKLLRQNKKKTLCQTEFSSRKSLPYDGKFLCILSKLLRYQSFTFYWSNFVLLDFELDKFISYSKVIPRSVQDK